MFTATIDSATLQHTLTAAEAVVDECRFHLEEDGVWIRAADPATIATVELSLDADAFRSFETTEAVIGVPLDPLRQVTTLTDAGDPIQLDLNTGTGKLSIRGGKLEYTLSLIDTASIRKEPVIPEALDVTAEVVMDVGHLAQGIQAAGMVADHLRLRVENGVDVVSLEAEGDTDDTRLELTADDVVSIQPGPANSLFALEYLKAMNGAMPSDGSVTTAFGTDAPLRLQYEFEDGGPQVTYLLAPRIQRV